MRSRARLAPARHAAVSRRHFLSRAAGVAGLGLMPSAGWPLLLAQADCAPAAAGDLVRTLPLYGPGAVETPMGQMLGGSGLDARFFTDLSRLDADRLVTPPLEVFVRTATPLGRG